MMRARGVLPCCDDGEVNDVVTLGQKPRRNVSRNCRFGAARERNIATLQLCCHSVSSGTCCGESGDLGCIFAGAQGSDDLDRSHIVAARQLTQEVDKKS